MYAVRLQQRFTRIPLRRFVAIAVLEHQPACRPVGPGLAVGAIAARAQRYDPLAHDRFLAREMNCVKQRIDLDTHLGTGEHAAERGQAEPGDER